MEAKAVQLIQDTAVAATAKPLETATPTVVMPDSAQIVSLEKFEAGRSRFRGCFSSDSLDDFAAYIKATPGSANQGFINAGDMNCSVFFNLGTPEAPGHGDHTALLSLKKTAAFSALERAADSKHDQKALSDWLEDWAPNVSAFDSQESSIHLSRAVGAIRSITIEQASKREHQVGDMSASRSAMDAIEAKSSQGLPAFFTFRCAPYEGLGQRTITLRLAVLTGGDKPVLILRWIGEEQLREDLAIEFKKVVAEKVGEDATLVIGRFHLG